ncbi:MAG TPA: hypothetical protein VHA82_11640 [Ramlibacter sp.]|uniref:beta strand repeat-containing protein n=1 Tax=Ramlibacter sp. TaxID=1917967 RepID=UPI002BDAE590|nr:hypothetical protein [Ramlibacter sp.]HVZ44453.1 hypothetical protein [Ramlibacter sp.]
MAITAAERSEIIELVVLMFDAAPGSALLQQMVSFYEDQGHSLRALADALGRTPVFASIHPNFETSDEFASSLLSPIGLGNDALAHDVVVAQLNAGNSKSGIAFLVWQALKNLSPDAAQQYQDAKAIVENRGWVAEYYSVTRAQSSSDFATLQDVVVHVGADAASVNAAVAAIDGALATGPQLTTGVDTINVRGHAQTNILGLVDGNADGNTSHGTFSAGDRITGNGHTDLFLTVIEGGAVPFARVDTIHAVHITAGTDATVNFQAGGWTHVDAVDLDDGVNGLDVFLKNLSAGTAIGISNVTGSVSADYVLGADRVLARIENHDRRGQGGMLRLDAAGNLNATLADSMAAAISSTDGVTLGNVTVHGGAKNTVAAHFDTAHSLAVGDVSLEAGKQSSLQFVVDGVQGGLKMGNVHIADGEKSTARLEVEDVTASATIGDVTLSAGAESDLSAMFSRVGGMLEVGNLTVSAGDDAFIEAGASDVGAGIVFGNVGIAAGDDAHAHFVVTGGEDVLVRDVYVQAGTHADLLVQFQSADGDVTLGNVSVAAGGDSQAVVEAACIGGDLAMGDFTAEAQEGSKASASILDVAGSVMGARVSAAAGGEGCATVKVRGIGEDISLGDVSAAVGDTGAATVSVTGSNNLVLRDVTASAGDSGTATVTIASDRLLGTVFAGGLGTSAGSSGNASLTLHHAADNVGTLRLGDLAATAGDGGNACISVVHAATAAPTQSNTGPAAGDMSVGDLRLSVGSALDASHDVGAHAEILYAGKCGGATLGDFMVGNIDASAGDGFLSGTHEGHAGVRILAAAAAHASVGDVTFGHVHIEAGDFADIQAMLLGVALGEDSAIGDFTLGDSAISGGEGASILYRAGQAATNGAEVGSFTAGDLQLFARQDSSVLAVIEQGIPGCAAALHSIGDFRVGDVESIQGDNSHVRIEVLSLARFDGEAGALDGDFSVGDVSVAVSATTSQDLSGRSGIALTIGREHLGAGRGTGGAFDVGNVNLSAGERGSIALAITDQGSWERMGDVAIGTLSIAAGANSTANGIVNVIDEAAGDFGSLAIEGERLVLGDDAQGSLRVSLGHANAKGDFGDVSLGDLSMILGASATATISFGLVDYTSDAALGDFAIGDVGVELAAGATAIVETFDLAVRAIGDVSIGDFEATLGDAGEAIFHPIFTPGKIGDVTLGDVHAAVGKSGSLDYSLEFDGALGIGDLKAGDWDAVLGKNATANLWLGAEALGAGGSVGAVSVGDVRLDFGTGANPAADPQLDGVGVRIEAASRIGGIGIGNISARADDGAFGLLAFQAKAEHAGDMVLGRIDLSVADTGLTSGTDHEDVGSTLALFVTNSGDAHDDVLVGDISLDVAGTAPSDEIHVTLHSLHGNVAMGNLAVSGKGLFSFAADADLDDNTSFLNVFAGGGKVTIGDVDFSGYEGNANLDLSWTTAGAAHITGGAGNDTILGNAGANVIAGGKGVDTIDIGQGGDDTVLFAKGDSGKTAGHLDTLVGFAPGTVVSGALSGGDKLGFGLAAGSAANYAERAANFGTLAEFIANANDVLNSTVKYFVQDDGVDTYVAVNYGSGEADLIVVLAGVHDATSLQYQNFIA